jgi:hypothetical protein
MHYRKCTALFLAGAVAILAACGDPTTSAPSIVSRGIAGDPGSAGCNTFALEQNARAYAASADDPLFTIIAELGRHCESGPDAATTDEAFDGLARLAAMRGTSAQKSDATGATFDALTRGFLGCMEDYITSSIPEDFSVAGALGEGWMYEVRGGQSDASAGSYERGTSPYWAAEATQGWAASIASNSRAKRFLIYGYQLPDYVAIDPTIGSGFEIGTIPSIASGKLAFSSPLTIGLCEVELSSTLRLEHVTTVLPGEELGCDPPPSFAQVAQSDWASAISPLRLVAKAAELLSPRPVYAAMRVGSVGGAVSELSPSVVIDVQSVRFTLVQPIAKGRISEALADANGTPVRIQVTTQNGTPLSGAEVTLAIDGNHGKPAHLRDGSSAPGATVTRTTAADGVATFDNVFLTKAGGYRLVASGGFDGIAAAQLVSNLFNMKNK